MSLKCNLQRDRLENLKLSELMKSSIPCPNVQNEGLIPGVLFYKMDGLNYFSDKNCPTPRILSCFCTDFIFLDMCRDCDTLHGPVYL
jgi:hypothetical protein